MGTSVITELQDVILESIKQSARGDWKIFVTDDGTKKLLDNVVRESDILQENVTNIEIIDEKGRPMDPDMDAVYLLAPEPYVVDCLVADMEAGRYQRFHLIWTSFLPPKLQAKLDNVPNVRSLIVNFRILNIDFFPKESHLITFRDPYSFPVLFHPDCNSLVRKHMDDLAQKIIAVCTTLGEYPIIRFYRPKDPSHEAGVLCSHLARFIQEGLDQYAAANKKFPPQSQRPRGVLMITDRTMDLFAPLIHEFTYQAMAHELLPLKDGDKTYYPTVVNEGTPNQEKKDMELGERDRLWVDNRHLHMKDLLEKLVAEFNKFRAENPQFAEESTGNPGTLNNIKDMLAGLPQFQEGKDLYSLHLGMAQECMNIFQKCNLPDIATAEQSMATGVDEDGKKPRNLTDQVVRLLDDDAVTSVDRLRLIMQYIIHRDGIFPSDLEKLLAHSQLPNNEAEMISNLEMLGAKVSRQIKDPRPFARPLFPPKSQPNRPQEDLSISRWEPSLKEMIEQQVKGTLDQDIFPYTKPQLDANDALDNQMQMSQSSLRSAKPTWARSGRSGGAPRQRMMVFVAGGATYSEARACYEISQQYNKDVYLCSSHMLTPRLFLKQLSDLGMDRRRLDLPADRTPRRAPAHILNQPKAAPMGPPGGAPEPPPSAGMANMGLDDPRRPSGGGRAGAPAPIRAPRSNGGPPPGAPPPDQGLTSPIPIVQAQGMPTKLSKDKGEKKKKGFLKFH